MTCAHENTEQIVTTLGPSRVYCVDCGLRMIDAPCPPIKLDYAEPTVWRKVDDWHGVAIHFHKTYIGALYLPDARAWALIRLQWCTECDHWEVAQDLDVHRRCHGAARVQYIAPDPLGVPPLPPAGAGAI